MKKFALFIAILTVSTGLYAVLGTALAGNGGPTYDDLPYMNDGNPTHVLDVYVPSGQGPFPVAIVIHGGINGDEDGVDGIARNLADHGFVGISVDYRDFSNPVWQAQLADVHKAIDWIRSHTSMLKADMRRFAVLGNSLGGFIAGILATGKRAYRPAAVATWSGKTDLTTFRVANSLILGTEQAKDNAFLINNSPALRVPRHRASPWFIANSKCEIVPLSQATEMAAALSVAGVPYQLDVVQQCLHASNYGYLVSDATFAFFHTWIGK